MELEAKSQSILELKAELRASSRAGADLFASIFFFSVILYSCSFLLAHHNSQSGIFALFNISASVYYLSFYIFVSADDSCYFLVFAAEETAQRLESAHRSYASKDARCDQLLDESKQLMGQLAALQQEREQVQIFVALQKLLNDLFLSG